VLEELAGEDALVELRLGEEVVVHAVFLPRARTARGGGDGELKLWYALQQCADESALPDTRGAGDDENHWG
jgi:hypothetical protein